jgi:uncharacterized Zn finger protein
LNPPPPRRRPRRGHRRRWSVNEPDTPHPNAPPGPKPPPPEHGIRVAHIGATWWGERWVQALERFGAAYARRLGRGGAYARQGRVHDLAVTDGAVSASVTGSRPTPYQVTFALKPLATDTWDAAIGAMAVKARFAAALLGGEMPREIDRAFAEAHASLFPTRRGDLQTACSCPDSANPCKHVAAVHFVLAEAFDRDPFLLFELRGRSRDAVLRSLRERRATVGRRAVRGDRRGAAKATEPASVGVELEPGAYDVFRQPVDDLRFRIIEPVTEGAVVRNLGAPPSWSLDSELIDLVQPSMARAAYLARAIGNDPLPEVAEPEGSEN